MKNLHKKLVDVLIRDINLEDDFMFAKVMSDRYICKQVLEKILKYIN